MQYAGDQRLIRNPFLQGTGELGLVRTYAEKAAAGLLDAKFLVSGMKEAATSDICQDITNFCRAVAGGKAKPLNFGDKRWKEA